MLNPVYDKKYCADLLLIDNIGRAFCLVQVLINSPRNGGIYNHIVYAIDYFVCAYKHLNMSYTSLRLMFLAFILYSKYNLLYCNLFFFYHTHKVCLVGRSLSITIGNYGTKM